MGAPRTVWRRIIGLDDHADDDRLYGHLVHSLFTSKSSLYSSNIMGLAVTVAAYVITGDKIFFLAIAATVLFGMWRFKTVNEFSAKRKAAATRRDYEKFDQAFFLSSLAFGLTIGLVSCRLIFFPPWAEGHALAAASAIGYAMGFVARNAGRPKLVIGQVVACLGLFAVGYALNHERFGELYVAMLLGAMIANIYVAISLYKNIVSVYHATTETEFLAHFDKLTRLANRFTFTKLVADAIENDPQQPFAVMFVDLDKFKDINDTLGHTVGDAVICEMARRIQACVGELAQIARFGGDEFLIKLNQSDKNSVLAAVQHLLATLSLPYSIGSNVVRATASLGVSRYPDHGQVVEELIKKADIALYEAKQDGGAGFRIFDRNLENKLNEMRKIETAMRAGIEKGEFIPYFQPIYSLRTHEIVSFEALARWDNADFAKVAPSVFIPIAENAGLIDEIGAQILRRACAAAKNWPDNVGLAVNVSAKQFRRPAHLFAAIVKALRETGLSPKRLSVEVTESLLISDPAATRKTIEQFALLGVQFSLDDFGTGYSSLSYLKDFPFRKIKIDKSFTDTMASHPASASIIRAVSQIASDIHLDVVAEGIESPEQETMLAGFGVKYGQGYYFSRPVPEAEASAFFNAPRRAQNA
jgi:diguanylate cyclase (GGDEF)-like protein